MTSPAAITDPAIRSRIRAYAGFLDTSAANYPTQFTDTNLDLLYQMAGQDEMEAARLGLLSLAAEIAVRQGQVVLTGYRGSGPAVAAELRALAAQLRRGGGPVSLGAGGAATSSADGSALPTGSSALNTVFYDPGTGHWTYQKSAAERERFTPSFTPGPGSIVESMMADDAVSGRVLAAHVVTEGKLATNSVDGRVIGNSVVSHEHINAGAVRDSELAAGAVRRQHIHDGEVLTAALGDDAVIGRKIAGNTIANGHLVDHLITSNKILRNQILNEHIAANAVSGGEIAAGAVEIVDLSQEVLDRIGAGSGGTSGATAEQAAAIMANTAAAQANAAAAAAAQLDVDTVIEVYPPIEFERSDAFNMSVSIRHPLNAYARARILSFSLAGQPAVLIGYDHTVFHQDVLAEVSAAALSNVWSQTDLIDDGMGGQRRVQSWPVGSFIPVTIALLTGRGGDTIFVRNVDVPVVAAAAPPTIPDGSITKAKLAFGVLPMFGEIELVPDGIADRLPPAFMGLRLGSKNTDERLIRVIVTMAGVTLLNTSGGGTNPRISDGTDESQFFSFPISSQDRARIRNNINSSATSENAVVSLLVRNTDQTEQRTDVHHVEFAVNSSAFDPVPSAVTLLAPNSDRDTSRQSFAISNVHLNTYSAFHTMIWKDENDRVTDHWVSARALLAMTNGDTWNDGHGAEVNYARSSAGAITINAANANDGLLTVVGII